MFCKKLQEKNDNKTYISFLIQINFYLNFRQIVRREEINPHNVIQFDVILRRIMARQLFLYQQPKK